MDKYEDLGLEASKFIEDLNMYEASRDGLFRTRRDAGNNPDFEETRKVFASKMTKIHMQKHQEEMAKNNRAMKMNGGQNSAYYTKDRPPINSYRQPGEAAAKPPILSGPVPAGNQFDGQKHTGSPAEAPASRAYGYGNNYDNKERLEPQSYQPPCTGNAFHSAPTHPRHPGIQPPAWAPSVPSQLPTSVSGSAPPISVQQKQNQAATPSVNRSPPPSWACVEPSSPAKPDLIPALPLSAFTGGAELHRSAGHYAPPSPTSRPSANHNGPSPPASSPLPSETPQPKIQVASAALTPGSVSKISSQAQGQGQASKAEAEVPCLPKHVQLPCQPPEQPPSSAEIKLEALTKRLEKEMDAQPKADYFGKINNVNKPQQGASVCPGPALNPIERHSSAINPRVFDLHVHTLSPIV